MTARATHLFSRHSTAASASCDFTAKHTLCSEDACTHQGLHMSAHWMLIEMHSSRV